MNLERTEIKNTAEKQFVVGCIVSDLFIRDILQLVDSCEFMESPPLKMVGNWCFDYYKQYKVAPKATIKDIFQVEKQNLSPDMAKIIDKLLSGLNTLHKEEEFNLDYYFKIAKDYIDRRHLIKLSEKINGFVARDSVEQAYSEVAEFRKIEKPLGSGIDLINDPDLIMKMFEEPEEDTFYIPGDLGLAIKDKYRGDVMGIGGRQKLGKSWMLMEFAKYAVLSGKKVCYFTLEMKDVIMAKRFFKSISETLDPGKQYEIKYPYFADHQEGGRTVSNIEFDYRRPSELEISICQRMQRKMKIQSKQEGALRIFDANSGGATMEQMWYALENLETYEDFLCDVMIIDYDDIVKVEGRNNFDDRARLNHVWLTAKAIAQQRNILVILASQNGRGTFKRDADVDDIAGDIRKFSHVSHWITLNQTPQEKKAHIMRIKVDGRHGDFNPLDEVVCLQNLAIGNPVIDSRYKRNITNYDEWVTMMNEEILE